MADNATDTKPAVTIPLPRLDAGLIVNLWALLSLAAIPVAVGLLLSDYRWGLLAAGVLGFLASTYVSRQLAAAPPAKVTPIKKAS